MMKDLIIKNKKDNKFCQLYFYFEFFIAILKYSYNFMTDNEL